MNCGSVTFTGEILKAGEKLGRSPTAAQIATLNTTLQALAHHDAETGAITMSIGSQPVDVQDYLAAEAAKFPSIPSAVPETSGDSMVKFRIGNSTGYRKAADPFAQIAAGIKAAEAAATAREVATWPNPWKGQVNRTRQCVITNTNPALAAKFKAEAGV